MKKMACISMSGALALALMAFCQPEEISAADQLQRIPAAKSLQPAGETVTPSRTLAVQPAQVYVTSASPDRPVLTAGGSDVSVSLSGTNMGLITSAQVLLSGRAVSNVTARLGTPSASSRELTLTALTDAAAGSYQVRLSAGSQTIDLTTSVLTVAVSGPVAAPRTAAGTDLRSMDTARQTALTPRTAGSTSGLTPATGSSLKVAPGVAQDRSV